MDLSRYRELLGRFHDVNLACGGRTAKVSSKWLAEFDRNFVEIVDRHLLTLHLDRVRRSADAIAILAVASIPSESLPLSKGLVDGATSELIGEVKRLQETLQRSRQVLNDRGVQGLVDEFLSSVVFVMDYVQFDFNGSSLTTFVWPEWSQGSETLKEGEPGYRDALCQIIGVNVSEVIEGTDRLVIGFTTGDLLAVCLQSEEAHGPESATFRSETGLLWIW